MNVNKIKWNTVNFENEYTKKMFKNPLIIWVPTNNIHEFVNINEIIKNRNSLNIKMKHYIHHIYSQDLLDILMDNGIYLVIAKIIIEYMIQPFEYDISVNYCYIFYDKRNINYEDLCYSINIKTAKLTKFYNYKYLAKKHYVFWDANPWLKFFRTCNFINLDDKYLDSEFNLNYNTKINVIIEEPVMETLKNLFLLIKNNRVSDNLNCCVVTLENPLTEYIIMLIKSDESINTFKVNNFKTTDGKLYKNYYCSNDKETLLINTLKTSFTQYCKLSEYFSKYVGKYIIIIKLSSDINISNFTFETLEEFIEEYNLICDLSQYYLKSLNNTCSNFCIIP